MALDISVTTRDGEITLPVQQRPAPPCVIVIFGAGKLPQLGKGLGEGIANFREGLNKGKNEPSKPVDEKNRPSISS